MTKAADINSIYPFIQMQNSESNSASSAANEWFVTVNPNAAKAEENNDSKSGMTDY